MHIRMWMMTFVACGALAAPLAAQDPAEVEALAPLLMAEDQRSFDPATLLTAVGNPDSVVRAQAALTLGRLADPRGERLLVPLLSDRDPDVVANAFFAFGLLRDTASVDVIIARLRAPDSLSAAAVGEAATALARIGGVTAAQFIDGAVSGSSDMSLDRQAMFLPNALLDGWKLGALMPGQAMVHYATDTSTDLRWRSLYSLGRLRVPASGRAMLNALRDPSGVIRENSAKWLTRRYADTAGLASSAVRAALVRALDDDQAGVRINALNALGTFADSADAGRVVPLLSDVDPNTRVAAVGALGALKGAVAAGALDGVMDRHDATWAMRHAALAALARVDSAKFAPRAATALASSDFRDRIGALQAWDAAGITDPAVFRHALTDPDPRVQAAAIAGWRGMRNDTTLIGVLPTALRSPSADVRTAALDALRPHATAADIGTIVADWPRALADPESDERLAVINALHAISRHDPDILSQLSQAGRRDVLDRPADPVVREEVARTWPELGNIWGDPWPIATGRGIDAYRTIVRTLLLAPTDTHVTVDVLDRGSIDLELLGHEAPLTVANFLQLVDQHYFDGNRWHRVVPDFVIQDGDRTGTGDGGPGWSIRDEINRERYLSPMVGMALSGPNTGGSQWFINVSPQPHLDGQYTIFGKVAGSYVTLSRITQGDVIRSIHR
jgi:cyclophilin family peptidyl-prolyl cis-trans isomerase/HEAT repeat protein